MEITELLRRAGDGDEEAVEQVFPLVYQELKRLAGGHLRGQNVTINATALVHEAYLRLAHSDLPQLESRVHFYGIASRTMRHVVVDLAREASAQKRGGGDAVMLRLEDAGELQDHHAGNLLQLDEALRRMEAEHPRQARVVEMKFFGGMTTEEIAELIQVSEPTVGRDLRFARAWLRRALDGEGAG